MAEDKSKTGRQDRARVSLSIDDNQDDLGRDVNNPENRIGDRATLEKTDPDRAKAERAHELSRKIGLQRERKRDDDPTQKVSGGFNQKH